MKLLHNLIAYTPHSASSSAPNYPLANIATPSVARYWQATGTAASWVLVDKGFTALYFGISDMPSGTVTGFQRGTTPGTLNPLFGSLPLHTDGAGRRKGHSSLLSHLNTYFRIDFSASNPPVQIGALYAFTSVLSLPDALLRSEIRTDYPQTTINLPNGQSFVVEQGPPRARITLRWRRPRSQDLEEIARICRAGICWLDLENPDQPGWQWPVRYIGPSITRQLATASQDEITLEFEEVA